MAGSPPGGNGGGGRRPSGGSSVAAGRNAKGDWKKRRSMAARMGIRGVASYGR